LRPPVRIGGGFGCSVGGSLAGENSDGLEKFRDLEFAFVNSKFFRVRDVKGWGCTVLKSSYKPLSRKKMIIVGPQVFCFRKMVYSNVLKFTIEMRRYDLNLNKLSWKN
jgi:hypothetical protein